VRLDRRLRLGGAIVGRRHLSGSKHDSFRYPIGWPAPIGRPRKQGT
jgi:hypothetical protein